MPLKEGSSRETVSSDIKEMMESGHPQAQAVAASLKKAGLSNKPDANEINTNEFAQLTSKPYTDAIVDAGAKCDALMKRMDEFTGRIGEYMNKRDANLMPNHDFLEAQRVGRMARDRRDAFAVQPRELKRGHEGG